MAKISKEPDDILNFPGEGPDPCGSGTGEGGGGGEGGKSPGIQTLDTITRIPDMDMYSTAEELTIEVEMPGVQKEDIELYIHKNTLKLVALKAEAAESKKTNYVCLERVFGRLYRSVEIPFPVNTSKIKATFKKDVLVIKIPRVEDKRAIKKNVPIESK